MQSIDYENLYYCKEIVINKTLDVFLKKIVTFFKHLKENYVTIELINNKKLIFLIIIYIY